MDLLSSNNLHNDMHELLHTSATVLKRVQAMTYMADEFDRHREPVNY